MYLKFKCLFVHLVTQNILTSEQAFVNKRLPRIEILHKNGRIYYNHDKNKETNMNYQFNIKPLHKQNGISVVPGNSTSSTDTVTQTVTTPMLFVTIPTVNPTSLIPTPSNPEISPIPTTASVSFPTFPPVTMSVPTPPNNPEGNKTIPDALTSPVQIGVPFPPLVQQPSTIPATTPDITSTVPSITSSVITSAPTNYVPTAQTSPVIPLSVPEASTINLIQTTPVSTAPQNVTTQVTSAVTQKSVTSPISFSFSPTTESSVTAETTAQYEMTFPYSETTQAGPVHPRSQIALQVAQDMRDLGAGYFTVFLLELARIFSKKEPNDATRLLQALNSQVMTLLSSGKLAGFGKSTIAALVRLVQFMNNSPIDAVQYQATLSTHVLMNRRQTLGREIVNLLDQADNVLIEEEGERIIHALEDLDEYPNVNKTASGVMHELLDAAVIAPMVRVYGTPEEISMVQQLETLVVRMVFSGYSIQRRRAENGLSITRRSEESPRHRTLTPQTRIKNHKNGFRNTYMELRSKFTTTKKPITVDNQINININHGSKDHLRPKKLRGVKAGKYKIIYVKLADLGIGKRTTKVYTEITKPTREYTRSNKEITNAHRLRHKKKITHNIDKDNTKRYKEIKRRNKKKEFKISRFLANKIKDESLFSDEEERLKANLDDALFHGANELVFRNRDRVERETEKDIFPASSYSNEETVLKSKIYKAFGYDNDFAEAVKRRG